MTLLGGQGAYFQKSSRDSETSDTTSGGLGEMFEGDFAYMCAKKFPLMSMGGRANDQECADGERGPGNFPSHSVYFLDEYSFVISKPGNTFKLQ